MSTHAKRSPSGLKALSLCPGFLNDTSRPARAADEGTMLHEVMEKNLPGDDLTTEQQTVIGKLREYIGPILQDRPIPRPEGVFREMRVNMGSLVIPGLTHGTADLVVFRGDQADLVDYKFGFMEVDDPEQNLQMWAYALGLFTSYPTLAQVTVHVLQPRRDEVGMALFTRNDIESMRAALAAIVARADQYDATEDDELLHPAEGACDWCGRKAKCPALAAQALRVAQLLHSGEDEFPMPDTHDTAQALTPAQVAYWQGVAKVVEDWAKAMKFRLVTWALEGNEVPGYALRTRSGTETLLGLPQAAAILQEHSGISAEDILSVASATPKQLMSLVRDRAPRGQKAKMEEEVLAELDGASLLMEGASSAYLVKTTK